MCLHKKHILPKISWKPITVYKVLFEEIDGDSLYTPYQDYKVSGIIIKARYLSISELTLEDSINGCGVHACKDLVVAKEIIEKWVPRVIDNKRCAVTIYECTIPPFTFYWEGKDRDIAARKIEIGKRIYYKNRKLCEFASFVQGCPYTLCTALRYCPPVLCPSDFKTCDNYKKAINEQQK